MGYYTGSGVVTNGTSAPNLHSAGRDVAEYRSYQRIKGTTTTLNGVSLAYCKSQEGDIDLTNYNWQGGLISFACKGTRKNVSYSQIGGSNLYSLNITDETIQFRAINASGDSGWVS